MVGEEDFGNVKPFIMARLTLFFINTGVFSSTQETYRTTRHYYEFIHNASPPFDYPKRALMISIYETI